MRTQNLCSSNRRHVFLPSSPPARSECRLVSPRSCCSLPALAQAQAQVQVCTGPTERLDQPLRRTGQRLAAGLPLTIVAIGSSSTSGAGASSSAATYPSRLEAELKERFPARTIRVLNRGVGGEVASEMLARFDTAVFAEQPDLVLWQVGTNSVLRGDSLPGAQSLIHEGVERLKAHGADVVLIDPQSAPKVIIKPDAEGHGVVDRERGQGAERRRVSSLRADAATGPRPSTCRSRRSSRPTACT